MGCVSIVWAALLLWGCAQVTKISANLEPTGANYSLLSLANSSRYTAPVIEVGKNNSSETRQSVDSLITRSLNFSLENIFGAQEGSKEEEKLEEYDGFEFVDSPESVNGGDASAPHGGVDHNVNGAVYGGSVVDDGGIVRQNSWNHYPNGTIIHDVRISLVHPANMVEIIKQAPIISAPDGSRKLPSSHNTSNKSILETSSISNSSAQLSANNSTTVPSEYDVLGGNDSIQLGNLSHSTNDSLIVPAEVGSTSGNATWDQSADRFMNKTLQSPLGQMNEKFSPIINLGISIDARSPCLSECLTKCIKAESNASVLEANASPSCSPSVDNFEDNTISEAIKEVPRLQKIIKQIAELKTSATAAAEENTTTASVPVFLLGTDNPLGKEAILNESLPFPPGVDLKMLKNPETSKPKLDYLLEDICLSENCVLKAAEILKRIDKSTEPCSNFFNFACGGYIKDVHDGESLRSVFSDISTDIILRMNSVLKLPIFARDSPHVKILKKFYAACIGTSPKDLFIDALKYIGGWPSMEGKRIPEQIWGDIAFNWTYGPFLEYNLIKLNLSVANETDKWMLSVDYPQFVQVALTLKSSMVLDEMERDINMVASALGIDNSTSRKVLRDVRIFMTSAIKYARVTKFSAEMGVYTLGYLKSRFPHVDLFKKLPALLKTAVSIDDTEMLYISDMKYLQKVDELLRDTPLRTQASHLVLTSLRVLSLLIGVASDTTVGKYCAKLTGQLFPQLIHHFYSASFVSNSKLVRATKILSHVRKSLLNLLNESQWMDEASKVRLIDQTSRLAFIWSHSEEINDDLEEIDRNFDGNLVFSQFIKTGIWNLKKATFSHLRQSVNSSLPNVIGKYAGAGFEVNAFYFSNHILIPPTVLHESIFDPDVPAYDSFSGLGLMVGHELIHALMARTDLKNSRNYRRLEHCMIDQFGSLGKKHSGGDGSYGKMTKDENIADQGGFSLAYKAFLEWHSRLHKEPKKDRLPGLQKFNARQMFWLTAAGNWCRSFPSGYPRPVDVHALPEFRINGQFANIPEFSQDFHCPADSPMNPKTKCSLW